MGEWLGLRPGLDEPGHYDFTEAVAVGKYNTGDHTGYETTTPWVDPGDEVDPRARCGNVSFATPFHSTTCQVLPFYDAFPIIRSK